MSDVLNTIGNVLTDEPIDVTVSIAAGTRWHKLMQRLKLKPKKVIFRVTQTKLGNLVRVSTLLNKIDGSSINANSFQQTSFDVIEKYADSMAEVLALVLYNRGKHDRPGQKEIDFIADNFSAMHMFQLMKMINDRMNLPAFTASIVLIKGLNILDEKDASAETV